MWVSMYSLHGILDFSNKFVVLNVSQTNEHRFSGNRLWKAVWYHLIIIRVSFVSESFNIAIQICEMYI